MRADALVNGAQESSAGPDLVGQCRHAQLDALARVALGLPVERLVLPVLLKQDHGEQAGAGKAARQDGAGAWLIFSQSRQVNFSRTCCTTFHCRGTTSSVSVTSSPSLASLVEPQQTQAVGPGTMIRSRGRCAGNGCRAGFRRLKARTCVVAAAAFSAATSS